MDSEINMKAYPVHIMKKGNAFFLFIMIVSIRICQAQAPGAPGGLTASEHTTNRFTVSWNAVGSATSYRLDVSTSSTFANFQSGYNNLTVTGTAQMVTGLTAGRRYHLRVRAVNASGTSGNSATVITFTIPQAPLPSPATAITSSSFSASWESFSLAGTTGYQLDVSTSSTFSSFVSGYNSLSITTWVSTVNGLAPGTTYYYRVREVNSSGVSTNSSTITVLTVPSAPVLGSSTSVLTNGFTANWQAVSGAESYRLDVSTNDSFTSFVNGYNNLTVTGTAQVITGLTADSRYYLRVRAVNASGTSGNSATIITFTIPQAPTPSPATAITFSSFRANWESFSSSGTTEFQLDVSTNSTFTSFVSGYNSLSITTSSIVVSGLSPSTTYYYRVREITEFGISSYSSTITVVTVPLAPVLGSSTAVLTNGFTANWQAVSGAESYRLDVSTDNSFASFISGYNNLIVSGTSQPITIAGVAAGRTYFFRVRAVNSSGASASSTPAFTITVPDEPEPLSASSITATSFTANWETTLGAASYQLDVSTTNSFSSFVSGYQNLSVITTSSSVTGLTPSTTYYYRVRAVNGSGVSVNSGTVTVLTTPPAPVAIAATSFTTTGFTANWQVESTAASYRLDVSTNSAFSGFVNGYNNLTVTGTNQLIAGLTIGTTYYYRVRGVTSSGATSVNSNFIAASTIPDVPEASQGSSITATGFTASWSSVNGAASYQLDVSTSDTFSSFVGIYNNLTVYTTNPIITGLSPNTTYWYRVRAVNSDGGTSISSLRVATKTAPSAPVINNATAITATSFTINWQSVSGATSYRLDVSTSSIFSSFVGSYNNFSVATTSQNVVGLAPNTIYYYRVRAVTSTGLTSANSIMASTTTLTAPPAPVVLPATAITTTSFTARWNTVSDAVSYRLDVSTNSAFSSFVGVHNNLTVSVTSLNVTGLSANVMYYYRVRAINSAGTSSVNSETISVVANPAVPNALGATSISATGFTANWGSVSGASSYRLDVSTNSEFSSFVGSFNNFNLTSTTQAVAGLTAGITYYYRVRAIISGSPSVNSGTIAVVTTPPAPGLPTMSNVTATGFWVSWFTVSGATEYRLDVSLESNFSGIINGYNDLKTSSTSYEVTGLMPSTLYYLRVRAVNSGGTSGNSIAGSITTQVLNNDQNFIRTIATQRPLLKNDTQVEQASINDKQISYQFFDGLGRPIQTVGVQQSPTRQDIVQPIAYDVFGREAVKYLPYVSGNTGAFKTNFLPKEHVDYASLANQQYQFYQGSSKVAMDSHPYSETLFEASPLNRPLKDFGAGQDWYANNKFIQHHYLINRHGTALNEEKIIAWVMGNTTNPVVRSAYYTTGQLQIKSTKDEQGNEVREYTDKEGRMILKKVQATAAGATNLNDLNGWALTYYVYDDFGNLRFVLPPPN